MKRMIVRSGNKIFPSNIENLILSNEMIEQIAIVQMENDKERHVPVAHIVIKEEFSGLEELIVEKLEKLIKENMPEHCIPYMYIFRNDLPLTGLQKIDFKKIEKESFNSCMYNNSSLHFGYIVK